MILMVYKITFVDVLDHFRQLLSSGFFQLFITGLPPTLTFTSGFSNLSLPTEKTISKVSLALIAAPSHLTPRRLPFNLSGGFIPRHTPPPPPPPLTPVVLHLLRS